MQGKPSVPAGLKQKFRRFSVDVSSSALSASHDCHNRTPINVQDAELALSTRNRLSILAYLTSAHAVRMRIIGLAHSATPLNADTGNSSRCNKKPRSVLVGKLYTAARTPPTLLHFLFPKPLRIISLLNVSLWWPKSCFTLRTTMPKGTHLWRSCGVFICRQCRH